MLGKCRMTVSIKWNLIDCWEVTLIFHCKAFDNITCKNKIFSKNKKLVTKSGDDSVNAPKTDIT